MQKPSIPSGTRDFSPSDMGKREYIFSTIKSVFKKYGYAPIETPAMENLSTLLGKYGEEGDKLLYKILNSGDFAKNIDTNLESPLNSNTIALKISEKGLRYDLTVPFARYVVQYRNDITFPFKRYQIQPVWRADKPQRGRYREFYQCDADVVGSNSLLNELELIQIIEEVFDLLNIKVKIKVNNRKILAGIAETIGKPGQLTDITIAIDKIEKIGVDKVLIELQERGLNADEISKLLPFLKMSGTTREKVLQLKTLLSSSEIGKLGLEELEMLFNLCGQMQVDVPIEFDLRLARGLNYYTGAILEVKALEAEIGSICGGGRYDDLTGIFGLPDVSGVGISFGADRIFDVLNQLQLFPEEVNISTQVLLLNFGEQEQLYCLNLLKTLRKEGIRAELYPDNAKIKKQMNYANTRKIPFVILAGEEEIKNRQFTLKNMQTGDQVMLDPNTIISRIK